MSFLTFGGGTIPFPIAATPLYVPGKSAHGFRFLHILTSAYHQEVVVLTAVILKWVACCLTVVLIFIPPMIGGVEYLFLWPLALFCLLGEKSVPGLCPFVSGVVSAVEWTLSIRQRQARLFTQSDPDCGNRPGDGNDEVGTRTITQAPRELALRDPVEKRRGLEPRRGIG